MPGKWKLINGVKYPTEHNTEAQDHAVQASQGRSFIHEGKEWTEVKTISLDQVLKILANKESEKKKRETLAAITIQKYSRKVLVLRQIKSALRSV